MARALVMNGDFDQQSDLRNAKHIFFNINQHHGDIADCRKYFISFL